MIVNEEINNIQKVVLDFVIILNGQFKKLSIFRYEIFNKFYKNNNFNMDILWFRFMVLFVIKYLFIKI